MSRKREELLWEEGWDGHHARQLERMARLPLVEKLRWLEEAHYLVRRLSAGTTPDPRAEREVKDTRAVNRVITIFRPPASNVLYAFAPPGATWSVS